ncbi:MAG: hypothetical protein LKG11_02520 [Bacilli bacterium]|jgi:hypothetical protein|nr:hypothetical protein [Bacilli bacterium]
MANLKSLGLVVLGFSLVGLSLGPGVKTANKGCLRSGDDASAETATGVEEPDASALSASVAEALEKAEPAVVLSLGPSSIVLESESDRIAASIGGAAVFNASLDRLFAEDLRVGEGVKVYYEAYFATYPLTVEQSYVFVD